MISILMPIYNGIEFINESLDSINRQSYKEWELIIGVNGHEENSEVFKKAKSYESDKIHVYDLHEYKGKSKTLNHMLTLSKYNWISLLDVDDIWHPEKLEKQVPLMDVFDIIGTNCQYFGDSQVIPYLPLGIITDFDFTKVNPIINSSCLVKKELCHWDAEIAGDYDMWLRLRNENRKFYNLVEILVFHRIHQASAFNSKGNHKAVPDLIKKHS